MVGVRSSQCFNCEGCGFEMKSWSGTTSYSYIRLTRSQVQRNHEAAQCERFDVSASRYQTHIARTYERSCPGVVSSKPRTSSNSRHATIGFIGTDNTNVSLATHTCHNGYNWERVSQMRGEVAVLSLGARYAHERNSHHCEMEVRDTPPRTLHRSSPRRHAKGGTHVADGCRDGTWMDAE